LKFDKTELQLVQKFKAKKTKSMVTKTLIRVTVFLLFFCSTILLHAQEKVPKSTHEVGASIGYNAGWFKDLNFSPIHYTQGGFLIGLDYRKVKINNGNSLSNRSI